MLHCLYKFAILFFVVSAILSAQSLNIVSGNGQVLFEEFLSQPMVVQALDASGKAVAGATITFTLTQGPSQDVTTATTDANGMASTTVISPKLQSSQSFLAQTVNAMSPQGSATFAFLTIFSSGPLGPAQPGTVLLAPSASSTGALVLTGASGATLPGAIQIGLSAASGPSQGQALPNVGIQTAPFDTFPLPGVCVGPGGVELSNALGVATCDLMITAAPGTYEFQISIGNLFLYRVFTLIVTPQVSCTYSLSASSYTIAAGGSTGFDNVLTAPGCSWTASSNVPWIAISSGASSTGSGSVGFTVSANTTGVSRSGTLTIAGNTLTINQTASATAGLSITSSNLTAATLNVPYTTNLTAMGGTPPYTWASLGALPFDFKVSPLGVVTGTPTATGTYGFTSIVTDVTGATSPPAALSFSVNGSGTPTFSFSTSSLPDAVVGQPYMQEVKTTGGCIGGFHSVITFAATGAFPPGLGLQLSGSQAFVAGTPTSAGLAGTPYSVTLRATDCAGTITRAFTIGVDTTAPLPAQFSASPASLTFNYSPGGPQPAAQSFTLSSATPGAAFTISSGAPWLVESSVSGTTPATLTAGITNDSNLTAGTYTGTITVAPVNGGTPLQIPVTLNVNSTPAVVATPAALVFNLTTAGAKSSGQQTIMVTSSGTAVNFSTAATTTSSTGWLSVSPPGASTPASLTVTANASSLIAGSYTGSVAIVPAAGPAVNVPVTLTVTGGPMLSVNPASLTFDVQSGITPAPQTLSLTSGPPIGFNIAISPASASSWLSVTTFTALTPASLNVAVNATGLAPGAYSATVTISDPSNSSPPVTIPIAVNVVASPIIGAVTNAASFQAGPVAPGELLVLFGSNLGPGVLASTGSPLGLSLAGTSVLFDGSPGVMIYTSAQQLAVIAPVGLQGRASTQIQVQYQNKLSLPVNVRVVDASPAIFTVDQSGQGAVVNQKLTPNSASAPAAIGSVVSIFGTGGGQTNPATVDGVPSSGAAPLLLAASVLVDGISAEVQYKGAAPGLAGVNQFNVKIPPGVRTGVPVPVLLTVGIVTAPPVTLYVQAP